MLNIDPDVNARLEFYRGTIELKCFMLHMITEYARHSGHADFLREGIDGATGE